MLKHVAFLLLTLLGFMVSCKEVKKLLTFEIENSQTITLDTGLPLNSSVVSLPMDVTTNSEDEFKSNNTQAEFVKDVTLKSFKLTITNPPTENFSFLKNAYVYIALPDNTNEVLLAYRENIPDDIGNTMELISTNEKLDKYVKSPSFKVRTKTTFDKSITSPITLRADMKFSVMADPL
ncbi:hypothetical protein HUW51_12850 [Adhaeribacter swui]|uniref:Uncharacterized protein n=1 Tax=Adhaeribacter swui TaxID=2086471 RepID=A0A7G7G8T1_9BACT|nr:hypothetical protein [Adhaeribacter swui]QNF33565.1 hypothetical protein HUW51_12850 [Adhaeribacter swui]